MKKNKLYKNSLSNKINKVLDIPEEVSNSEMKVTIIGFDEMLIENYKGILEYEEFYVKIKTNIGNMNINGLNLNLDQITEDDILVKGKIKSIELDKMLDEEGET